MLRSKIITQKSEVLVEMNEFDVVKAKRDLSSKVFKNCIGTIVMIYEKPRLGYEVEFINEMGETIELLTVKPQDVSLYQRYSRNKFWNITYEEVKNK